MQYLDEVFTYISKHSFLVITSTLIVVAIILITRHYSKENQSYDNNVTAYKNCKIVLAVAIVIYIVLHAVLFYHDTHKKETTIGNGGIYNSVN